MAQGYYSPPERKMANSDERNEAIRSWLEDDLNELVYDMAVAAEAYHEANPVKSRNLTLTESVALRDRLSDLFKELLEDEFSEVRKSAENAAEAEHMGEEE